MDAIAYSEKDNVATALRDLKKGQVVQLTRGSVKEKITLLEDIPFGHKFALEDIPKGYEVVKYGEPIGEATTDIKQGEYVHVHNVTGKRGVRRGKE